MLKIRSTGGRGATRRSPKRSARRADPAERRIRRLPLVSRHGARVVRGRAPSRPTSIAHFVAIKVDREERPDVDAVYMEATQAMTGQGGWPMTCLLTPAGEPFFCGTYFPPVDRPGMPSFGRVLAVGRRRVDRRAETELEKVGADVVASSRSGRTTSPLTGMRHRGGTARRGRARVLSRPSTTPSAASVGRRSSRPRWCWSS